MDFYIMPMEAVYTKVRAQHWLTEHESANVSVSISWLLIGYHLKYFHFVG